MMKIYHEPSLRKQQRHRTLIAVMLGFLASSALHLSSDGSEVIATAHASDHATSHAPLMFAAAGEEAVFTPRLTLSTQLTSLSP